MYCAHCYRDAGCPAAEELSTDEAFTLLDQIAKAGFKIMIFSGGEPLMRPDILELVKHAADLKLIPVFGTNGTLITRDMAQRLKNAGLERWAFRLTRSIRRSTIASVRSTALGRARSTA